METFIGTIMPVAFNFAPQGWALCNGQLMSISQNSALFALLGVQYKPARRHPPRQHGPGLFARTD